MRTDDLVDILSRNVDAADWRRVSWTIPRAAGLGAVVALLIMLLTFGPRADLSDVRAWTFLAVKFAYAGATIAISLAYLVRIARPGGEQRVSTLLLSLPSAAAVVAVILSLLLTPMPDWRAMIFGQQWLLCLVCIPLNAIPPFAAIVLALRLFASPTHLARTGALAGRVSGGISAFVYALHCTDDSVAFVGLWYGLTIALCTGIGALLGPRLLRW
jgi:hypothetical protein